MRVVEVPGPGEEVTVPPFTAERLVERAQTFLDDGEAAELDAALPGLGVVGEHPPREAGAAAELQGKLAALGVHAHALDPPVQL